MLRLFAGIPIPEDLWDGLDDLHEDLPGAQWRIGEQYHITLCFFGSLSHAEARDLDGLIAEIRSAPFELTLDGTGWFGKRNPDALHARVRESEALRALASGCERAARRLRFAVERGPYVPHVTLAYLSGTPIEAARGWTGRNHAYVSEPFRVDGFHLYSSHRGKSGGFYVTEADYRLE